MSDPFLPPNSESQLIREAKIGFSLVLIVVLAIGGWVVFQYRQVQNQIPDHVRNAPVARHVGPEDYLRHLDTPVVDSQIAHVPAVFPNHGKTESESAVPRFANNTESAADELPRNLIASQTEANKAATDESINATLEIQRLNENIDQLSHIVNSFASNVPPSEQSKIVAESFNPIGPAVARDLSNDLPTFQSSHKKDSLTDRPPANELVGAQANDRPIDDSNLFRAADNNRDVQVKPVNFEENISGKSNPEDSESKSADLANPTRSDEEISLEIIDPQTADTASGPETIDDDNELHYRTVNGDSFWSIAQLKYGDGRYFSALFEHNRQAVENYEELPANLRIMTPRIEVLQSRYPRLCPTVASKPPADGQKYTTVEGDTLFHIARQTTGQASRYLELLKLNRDRLPMGTNHLTRLQADLELRLPH